MSFREAAQSDAGKNAGNNVAAGSAWSSVRLFTARILAEVEWLEAQAAAAGITLRSKKCDGDLATASRRASTIST